MGQQVDGRPLSLFFVWVGVDAYCAAVSPMGEVLHAEDARVLFVG